MITAPVLGLAARSGTGKTTLLETLIPLLKARGYHRVAVIKHSHHFAAIDTPGKDSDRIRRAGASEVLLSSPCWFSRLTVREDDDEPSLDEALAQLSHSGVDMILVEGFRHAGYPKLEIYRGSCKQRPLFVEDSNIIAVATDGRLDNTPIPQLPLNEPALVADFIAQWIKNQPDTIG